MPTRYIAFFVDESQLGELPKNPSTEKLDILEGRTSFDMRQLHSFALLDPAKKVLPSRDQKAQERAMLKQSLIYQFEKAGGNAKDNCIWKSAKCCIRCFMACLDCCIKFINKNAYI